MSVQRVHHHPLHDGLSQAGRAVAAGADCGMSAPARIGDEAAISVSVKAAVPRDGQLLLLAYDDDTGFHYNLPGGRVRVGETLRAAVTPAAHTISARFGHDITGHSAGYIAGWIRGDVDRFKQLLRRVGQVARQLVPPD